MAGALEGIRVVEIGVWVAGPAAGCVLGDWGADVVKIEPPGLGDPARMFSKMLGADLPFNPPFEMDNRNKRSIVLDLTKEEGKALAYELIDSADVFVSNVRPAALRRLGFDAETLMARNPRLIARHWPPSGWLRCRIRSPYSSRMRGVPSELPPSNTSTSIGS